MTYENITFKDKNPIKRYLQKQRLVSAITMVDPSREVSTICDFGSGNGELCKLLSKQFPNAHIICYDPSPRLLNEAKENLKGIENISFVQHIEKIEIESMDLVFSLEVFEHLPITETMNAFQSIKALMNPEGLLIIGVPVEIGIPAFYKGVFRMVRRYGYYDANLKNVFLASIGQPPLNRPIGEITPGFNYHFDHLGFDWRKFSKLLEINFMKPEISSSPFSFFGRWLMPEIYFKVKIPTCKRIEN